MPKYSPSQDTTFALISDSLAVVSTFAAKSSDADKALLEIAKRAAKFASNWVRCNTENNGRGEMRANGRALAERALTDSKSAVGLAFIALGHAYQSFADCSYREANTYAVYAQKMAATSEAKIKAVMARA